MFVFGDLAGQIGVGLLITVLGTALLWLLGKAWKRWGLSWWRERRERRQYETAAPFIVQGLLSYMTHLRDGVMETFWRARDDPPEKVRERVRRQIMEPVRGFLSTLPGEEVKIVWFRPTADGKSLVMYEQVGHSPEGQTKMRLPIGSGLAGKAFVDGEWVYSPNCEIDERFQNVEKGKAQGSIACAPIVRAGQVTGVLSVMSTCQDAFWLSERRYFEALAAAIAAIETLEVRSKPKEA